MQDNNKFFIWIAFLTLCIIACNPLFHNLGALTLRTEDESRIAVNAIEMMSNSKYLIPYYEGSPDTLITQPPLLTWFIIGSMNMFGFNETGVRLPSAIAAFSIIIYMFVYSYKHLNDWKPGFISGLVLCSTVGFIDHHVARNGDFDSMLSLFAFLYVLIFFLFLQTQNKKYLILSAIAFTLAFLTKGVAGFLMLPGITIFMALSKEHRHKLVNRQVIVTYLSALLIGLSYYIIRNIQSPGYIRSVIYNEISGKFIKNTEGNYQPFKFYISEIVNNGFSMWIFPLLISLIIIPFSRRKIIKEFAMYILICSVCFLLIHSFSATKLPWDLAPFYPLAAILIGGGFSVLVELIQRKKIIASFISPVALILFFVFFLIGPFQKIMNTSVKSRKENRDPKLFFGDLLKDLHLYRPEIKSVTAICDEYNPSLRFYFLKYEMEGLHISIKNSDSDFIQNEEILFSDAEIRNKLNSGYEVRYVSEEGNRFSGKINRVKPKTELASDFVTAEKLFITKIQEIKNNADWFASIRDKSLQSGIDPEKQIKSDAVWTLHTDKQISAEMADELKKKYNL